MIQELERALQGCLVFLPWYGDFSSASPEKTQRLGETDGWRWNLLSDFFTHLAYWLKMAVNWDLSWGCQLEYLLVVPPGAYVGFLTVWWLSFRSECPWRTRQMFYYLLWLCLRSYCHFCLKRVRSGGTPWLCLEECSPSASLSVKVKVLVSQSCLILCDPMACSPRGSSVHGILQARILEWITILFSRRSSWPRDQTQVSCIAGRFFTFWARRETTSSLNHY